MGYATQRRGFKIQSPLTDVQIWGIGMVTYQWGCLENEVDFWTNAACGKPLTRSSGQRASFKERVNLLRATFDEHAREPWRSKFMAALDRAKEMQAERDAIVHQLWAERPSGAIVVNEWRKGTRWTERAIEPKNLQALSLKIDSARAEIMETFLKVCKEAGIDPSGTTLTTAWQLISGKREPNG